MAGRSPFIATLLLLAFVRGRFAVGRFIGRDANDDNVRQAFIEAHNTYRSIDAQDATNMLEMAWDYQLEAYAMWHLRVNLCNGNTGLKHSPKKPNGEEPWRPAPNGENLFAQSTTCSSTSACAEVARRATKAWYDEKTLYKWGMPNDWYQTNVMKIGHYMQVVRDRASAVGCAIVTDCGPGGTFVGCQYNYGNYGNFPYTNINEITDPDLKRSCSQCPIGYNCCGHDAKSPVRDENLCVGYPTDKETSEKPPTNLKEISKEPCWPSAIRPTALNGGCGEGATVEPVEGKPSFPIQQCKCNGFDFDTFPNPGLTHGLLFTDAGCIYTIPFTPEPNPEPNEDGASAGFCSRGRVFIGIAGTAVAVATGAGHYLGYL